MKKKKERKAYEMAQLEMTPMIDVVFQLLIFFIVTIQQEDILSHLDVNRPAPDDVPIITDIDDLFKVTIWKEGFVLQGRKVPLRELERQVKRLGELNKKTSIVIQCTGDSPHAYLVQFLDACSKAQLTSISVFSL